MHWRAIDRFFKHKAEVGILLMFSDVTAQMLVGRQLGVFGLTILMVKTGLAQMPYGATKLHIYGIACLAGVGFTMRLFIGGHRFDDPALMNPVRLGVLSRSVISGIMGHAAPTLAAARSSIAEEEAVTP